MENKLNFTDFSDSELIGKKVLINGSVNTISRVTAKYFGIDGSNDLFEKRYGRERGGSTWHTKYAQLVTEEYADKIIQINKQQRQRRKMIQAIKDYIVPFNPPATIEQLTEIIKILKLEDKIN